MKRAILLIIIFGVIFGTSIYVLAQTEDQIFQDIINFVEKKLPVARREAAEFFILNPGGHAICGGKVQSYQDNILTINSQGYITKWGISTSTEITPKNVSISIDSFVRVLGIWNGNNLVTKKIIVYQPKLKEKNEALKNFLKILERLQIRSEIKEQIRNMIQNQIQKPLEQPVINTTSTQ